MSAMWDIFIATVMTFLFGTMRIALFCIFWVLVLIAVPTIFGVL